MWSDLALVGLLALGITAFAVWWTIDTFDTADELRKWAEEMTLYPDNKTEDDVKERGQE